MRHLGRRRFAPAGQIEGGFVVFNPKTQNLALVELLAVMPRQPGANSRGDYE